MTTKEKNEKAEKEIVDARTVALGYIARGCSANFDAIRSFASNFDQSQVARSTAQCFTHIERLIQILTSDELWPGPTLWGKKDIIQNIAAIEEVVFTLKDQLGAYLDRHLGVPKKEALKDEDNPEYAGDPFV